MRVLDATGRERAALPISAGIEVLLVTNVRGDNRGTIIAGWGQDREHMNAVAAVTEHHFNGTSLTSVTLFAPTTERNEIVALVPMADQRALLVAYFESKYMVASTIMRPGANGWTSEPLTSLRTATTYARGDLDGDRAPELVVGRVYGDDGGDGEAFVLAADGTRTPISTTRGVRALAVADTDADGRAEVFVADGWHKNYGQHAKALLSWARRGAQGFTTELIEDTVGQYEITRIIPAQIAGKTVIVTLGTAYVRAFVRNADRWVGTTVAKGARDIAVGNIDGTAGDELLVIGDRSALIDLSASLQLRD